MSADPFVDALAAGALSDSQQQEPTALVAARTAPGRRIKLTAASTIPLRSVRWTWTDRLPEGALSLIAGREGIGKSLTLVYLTAHLTRGTLPGSCHGTPRSVIYAASEDSWSHTIAPRLVAAGADLDLVYRVDVEDAGTSLPLTLPVDCAALEVEISRRGVALLAVDPLASVIEGSIDTHRDRELRTALEPMGNMADRTGCAVVGLVHHGKGSSTDPLSLILGSRAFTAVARAVHAAASDPDDEGTCVLSLEKSNLGSLNVPGLKYVIESVPVSTVDGQTDSGRLRFTGNSDRRVRDILRDGAGEDGEDRSEAAAWLLGYLGDQGGEAKRRDVSAAAKAEGISESTLKRARQRARVTVSREGFASGSVWRLPTHSGHHSALSVQGTSAELNGLNEPDDDPYPSRVVPLPSHREGSTKQDDPALLYRCADCGCPVVPSNRALTLALPTVCRACA